MSRLAFTKPQHLRLEFFLSWSNWTCAFVEPTVRMSATSLIQRYACSCSRVSLGGAVEADISHSGTPGLIRRCAARPQKFDSVYRNQQRKSTSRYGYAESRILGDENTSKSGDRQTTQDQIIQNIKRNPLDSWTLWQTQNCSVQDIARMRGITELQVYEQICECVQQGNEIDWYELCQEAGFSTTTVLDINFAKLDAEKTMEDQLGQQLDEFGRVPVQCGLHVTDVHVLLYNTMMACGITPLEIVPNPIEERQSQVFMQITASNKVPSLPKKSIVTKSKAAAHDVTSASKGPNAKVTSSDKSPTTEEADNKKTPRRLTQKHMLQWMTERNGVTLMELVSEFQGYNECQLMRLILLLERKNEIFLDWRGSHGIFRVTEKDEQSM
ncbi:uncharacterized protein [Physcomitrium patens]|uniref:Helicase Helix-turn-helix domain-containing protein n=1 Tax=Physcomitrium patens TaxID=3218 RepID=A0A2K1K8C7_PHYPA|nr:uncharacterized protein LOC112285313 [Physcomitrium patens]PNR50028.1 hypothetical protein PHYPA_011925 [Physcomitrium patens]|eukprot:XP_024381781.1 uncharacterized protein LOC112285313 [Physcomitrella patens]